MKKKTTEIAVSTSAQNALSMLIEAALRWYHSDNHIRLSRGILRDTEETLAQACKNYEQTMEK